MPKDMRNDEIGREEEREKEEERDDASDEYKIA